MEHLVRAAHLLVLAVAPQLVSTDPAEPASVLATLLSVVGLVALVAGALAFRRAVGSTTGSVAAALGWIAVAAALGTALLLAGRDVPLGRGAPYVAVPVWAALATAASAAAGEWLGSNWKHKRMGAAVAVLVLATVQLTNAAPTFKSDEAMWKDAARRDPGNERAVAHVGAAHVAAKRLDEARKLAERCLAVRPTSCTCLELAATAASRTRARDRRDKATAAVEACPERASVRAVLAETLALEGDLDGALKQIDAGLAMGGEPARFEYVRALSLERAGRFPEAVSAAEKAIAAGAGRDAKLLLGALQMANNQLEAAAATLAPLARDNGNDTDVAYNVALIADRRGDYNLARQGYLNVVRLDPDHANARYNLALLCHRAGVQEEARHHARRFAEAHPDDARAKKLLATVGAKASAVPEKPTPPP